MAWDVHIHVCFPCDRNEAVAELAKKHLPSIASEDDGPREARWFLESLSTRAGNNPGPKGGLSLWGMVGNHTRAEAFCECLKPFWTDLLSEVDGGPLDFEHVIVFEEQEQSEAANAYEIMWDDPHEDDRKLVIKKHDRLPFGWQQA